MKKQTHRTLLHRLFCLLMALHVINLSVDTPDGQAFVTSRYEHHDDLSVNDIESLSELLLESCFGFTDAVPEHDERDSDSSLTSPGEDYIFTQPFIFTPFSVLSQYVATDLIPYPFVSVSTPVSDVIAPPPQLTA